MATQYANVQINGVELQGLLPGLDRRQPKVPFVLDGRDFLFDLQGPYSGFGSRHLTRALLTDFERIQTLRAGAEIMLMTDTAVLGYDTPGMFYYPRFTYDANNNAWPWSYAFIAGKHYFCKKGSGIIEYNPEEDAWAVLDSIYIPLGVKSIAEYRGRLIALGDTVVAWSAQDDAEDFTPSLATGAGQQGVLLGTESFMVFNIAAGFLVYTNKGVMISEFSGTTGVFRHRVLTQQHAPIGPYAIVAMDEGVQLFIDKKGFFTCDGKLPQLFDATFSEYLTRTLLPQRDLTVYTNFRLHYAPDQQLIILSMSAAADPTQYQKAWVLYRPVNKWGSFDRVHYGFGELALSEGPYAGFNFGYICPNGMVHKFTGESFKEIGAGEYENYMFWRTSVEVPMRLQDGVFYATSTILLSAEPLYLVADQSTGLYKLDIIARYEAEIVPVPELMMEFIGDAWYARSNMYGNSAMSLVGPTPFVPQRAALESWIEVGLLRYTNNQFDDQMGRVNHVSVGMDEVSGDVEEEDWLELEGEEDWLTASGEEDWGLGISNSTEYLITLLGTNDSVSQFSAEELQLLDVAGRQHRYPADTTSIWQVVRISAMELPETFHLKTLELSGTLAGRLW